MYHRDAEIPHSKYYVYLHINPLTQKVFYVGSARGNYLRAYEFDKHRNEKWKKEVLSFGGATNVIVKIVKYFKNPHEAQEYEFKLLCHYRDVGEAYCCDEGDWSFERKNPTLKYVLVHNYTEKCININEICTNTVRKPTDYPGILSILLLAANITVHESKHVD